MFSIRTRWFLILCLLFASLALTPSSQPVHAYNVCIWTGAAGNGWDNPANWNNCGGTVPTAIDWVSISNGGPVLNGSTTVTRLDINPTGAMVAVSGAVLTANLVNMNGHFTGPGEMIVLNTFNYGTVQLVALNDGVLDGNGKITINLTAHGYIHHNGEDLRLINFTLENHGIIERFSDFIHMSLSDNSLIDNYGIIALNGSVILDLTYNNTIMNHPGATIQSYSESAIHTAVINDGIVDVKSGILNICRGGPNSGEYKGSAGTTLIFGTCNDGMITANSLVFSTGSILSTPNLDFLQPGDNIDIHGVLGPIGTSSSSSFSGTVIIHDDATINSLGNSLISSKSLTIEGVAPSTQYDLSLGGYFSYAGTINVSHLLVCSGIIANTGMLRLLSGGIMRLSGCTLNLSSIENQGNGFWIGDRTDINLFNGTIENDGTFNLAQGDTISGDEGSVFINNGTIRKELYTNTTTFDLPFENNGVLDIRSGTVVFSQAVSFPQGTVNNIDGNFQVSELINNGTLNVNGTITGDLTNYGELTLDGTVTGDLTNAGYMEIGHSPGLAIVLGNFTQPTNSALRIELSEEERGDLPIPGVDFDQVQVTGTASVAGELILDKGDTFIPEDFIEFPIIIASGGVSGPFTSLEISNMIDNWPWYLEYRSNEITILLGGIVLIPFISR
ncbi:MAG: hypothetical protein HGB14_01775 [Anaerolineaceae bacterium]|nr:hypothetical protein [Anaerolineaceae bacterium]